MGNLSVSLFLSKAPAQSFVGCPMKSYKAFLFLILLPCLSLTSCYHEIPGGGGGGGGGGTGTATLSLTMQATPLTPPPGTNILSMTASINGVSLTPTSGSAQNFTLPSPFVVDFTKLQSDSLSLGTLSSIPAGTYTITLSISGPVVYYCTQPNPGTQGCAAGSVAKFSGAVSTPSVPTTITLSANQKTGLALVFNLQNALTVNTTTQAVTGVSFTATNVLTSSALPSASNTLATGQLDFVEDVTGVVTSSNNGTQTVTISTATGGSFTAAANSSTVYAPTSCAANTTFATCVVVGQIASVDAALNSDGTYTMLEYDPLSSSGSFDIIEGVVTAVPTSSSQFQLVANNLVFASSGSKISGSLSSLFGSPVNITLVNTSGFLIDNKGLTIPSTSFLGGTDTSVLVPGQTVAAEITSFTAASGNILASANADLLILRFTRLAGAIASPAGLQPSITNLPPYFGQTTPELVQLSNGTPPSSPSTYYDGVDPANGGSLTSAETVSIRGLYFGATAATPFSAAKVRVP